MIWKLRSGAPWRDLPERFGDWKNAHKRFSRAAQICSMEGSRTTGRPGRETPSLQFNSL